MWALRFGLLNPLPQTVATAKFGAVRAHDGIRNRSEANEATENLFKLGVTHGITPTGASCNASGVDRLNTAPTVIATG